MCETVSVVIPVYNIATYVEACVASVKSQSYTQLEIILVDDGSNDGSSDICDRLALYDNRIVVIHQPNMGLSAARNSGTRAAKGSWLVFIDGDDVVDTNYIRALHNAAISSNSDIAVCIFSRIASQEDFATLPVGNRKLEPIEILDSLVAVKELFSEKRMSTAAWGKLARTEIWRKHLFPVGRYFEDLPTTWRLLLENSTIALVSLPLYGYVQRGNSISSAPSTKALVDYQQSITETYIQAVAYDNNLKRSATFRCCLESSRLLEMLSRKASNDEKLAKLRKDTIRFIRLGCIQSLCNSYASLAQRLRICITSVYPPLALLLKKSYGDVKFKHK